jgi:hypothetical protein
MTATRTGILIGLLIASLFSAADSTGGRAISAVEYSAELDRLSSATQQLDSSGRPTPEPLRELPQSWRVRTDQREFEISAEGLRRDIRRYEAEKNAATAIAVQKRIESLRAALDGYEKSPSDVSAERKDLNTILARPEFSAVHGPTWVDRVKEWVAEMIALVLRRVFRSAAIPTIGKFLVYGLMAIAILALGYLVYRNLVWGTDFEALTPTDPPVSAKEWAVWLAESRAMAGQGKWRDAIHFAYWAGISFLERQGTWKPDSARTPREYLGLLSSSSEHRETLTALTRIFELAWYGKRGADERTFSEALEQLGKLGCQ